MANFTPTFNAEQLGAMRKAFASIKTVNPDRLADFRSLFAKCSDEGIRQLVGAGINFVSKLAGNELIRRGLTVTPAAAPGGYKASNGRPFRV